MGAIIYDLETYRLYKMITEHLKHDGFKINFTFHDAYFQEMVQKFMNDKCTYHDFCIAMGLYIITKNSPDEKESEK